MSFLKQDFKIFQYGEQTHPVRDWLTLLIFSAILLATSIIWNVYLFSKIASGEMLSGVTSAPVEVFDNANLMKVEGVFKRRAILESGYESGDFAFTDPSR